MIALSTQRRDLVEAAHVLSRLGLVTAYGHVSARTGASMLITPAADLDTVAEAAVVEVPLVASSLPPAAPRRPGRTSPSPPGQARRRVDRARPARQHHRRGSHDPSLARCTDRPPGWANRSPCATAPTCCGRPDLAERAARTPPTGEALLLRGNGAHPRRDTRRRGRPHVAAVDRLRAFVAAQAAGRSSH